MPALSEYQQALVLFFCAHHSFWSAAFSGHKSRPSYFSSVMPYSSLANIGSLAILPFFSLLKKLSF
jgi:hypothetical protein